MSSLRNTLRNPEEFRAPLHNLNQMDSFGRVCNREKLWAPDSKAKTAVHSTRSQETRKI